MFVLMMVSVYIIGPHCTSHGTTPNFTMVVFPIADGAVLRLRVTATSLVDANIHTASCDVAPVIGNVVLVLFALVSVTEPLTSTVLLPLLLLLLLPPLLPLLAM